MSFFGKKFKKVKAENAKEIMEALNLGDQIKSMFSRPDSTTSFTKNADGSIQYVVEDGGVKSLDEKFFLGVEAEYTGGEYTGGKKTKNLFTLDGDVLKSSLTREDGTKINFVRSFEGNTMKMIVSAENVATTATIYYEEV